MTRGYKSRNHYGIVIILAVLTLSTTAIANEALSYKISTLAKGLKYPSSMVFLPEGDLLVAERSGMLRVIRKGVLSEKPVINEREAIPLLRDIVLHPRFEQTRWVYLSTIETTFNRIRRGEFLNGRLQNIQEIFRTDPTDQMSVQAGGRMVFLPDETLLITVGDAYKYREEAQNLKSLLGKIIRLNADGSTPESNPFVGQDNARAEVWSYGHRHVLGMAYDPVTGSVYANEHGPQGGDELNLILSGKNYGWPIATEGLDYSGAYVSPYKQFPGTEKPLVNWTPSIAPSGLTQCHACQWSEWEGDLFSGMLRGQQVRRTRINEGVLVEQERLFQEMGERVRDVRFGPDGALYILTDSINGRVLKVSRDN